MGKTKKPPNIAVVGVPTTTPVAFLLDGTLYLERMNALASDGAGILCETVPPIGTILQVVFRLSTALSCSRGKAEVLGDRPTTPAVMRHVAEHGEVDASLIPMIPSGGISDSATAIFRLADLPRPSPTPTSGASATKEKARVSGFCIHFLDLDAKDKAAIEKHIRTSRALADRLAAQEGRSVSTDRPVIADTFHSGDLSKRALDW